MSFEKSLTVHCLNKNIAGLLWATKWCKNLRRAVLPFLMYSISDMTQSISGRDLQVKISGKYFFMPLPLSCASLVAQMVKNLPAMQETWV